MDKKNIFVVSGPPCSGKTYFINNTLILPEWLNKLGIGSEHTVYNANEIRLNNSIVSDRTRDIVIHYDSLRSFKRNIEINEANDSFLKCLKSNGPVTFIILSTDLNILKTRMEERILRLKYTIDSARLNKLERLLELYNSKENFEKEHNSWLLYCK